MAFKVVVVGEHEFYAAMDVKISAANLAARNIVYKGGEVIRTNAKKEFRPQQPKSVPAVPTRPTERTGNLKRSIAVTKVSPTGKSMWVSETGPAFGPAINYAKYVETGTSRSRPYPYMKPGFDKSIPEITTIAMEEWRIALES
jgi:HK97 gp10 family phage protein